MPSTEEAFQKAQTRLQELESLSVSPLLQEKVVSLLLEILEVKDLSIVTALFFFLFLIFFVFKKTSYITP